MIKIINKNNWSGEEAKINISPSKQTLSLYGVCGESKWEKFNIFVKYGEFTSFHVTHKDYGIIVTGHLDKIWYAQAEVERSNKCLYTAIAQVLYNTL